MQVCGVLPFWQHWHVHPRALGTNQGVAESVHLHLHLEGQLPRAEQLKTQGQAAPSATHFLTPVLVMHKCQQPRAPHLVRCLLPLEHMILLDAVVDCNLWDKGMRMVKGPSVGGGGRRGSGEAQRRRGGGGGRVQGQRACATSQQNWLGVAASTRHVHSPFSTSTLRAISHLDQVAILILQQSLH